MHELARNSLRLAVGLVVVVVGLVEVQSILQGLRSQRRLRQRVVESVRDRVLGELPRLAAALAGRPEPWEEAASIALATGLATEVEVFELSGRQLTSRPTVAPVAHWPGPREMEALRSERILTVAAHSGPTARIFTYLPLFSGGRALLFRLATAVPDLEEDLRERQQVLLGHLVALAVLLLAGGLALIPQGPRPEPPPPRLLDAYEQAMVRLRDRGEELSREHEAERRRMEDEIREKEAMARAGELTAGIVHEVRNGLGTIVGYARLLEKSPAAEAAEAGQRIREECETLEIVVRRFMDFVKRETLGLAPFDLGRMLTRVVARELRNHGEVAVQVAGAEEAGSITGDEELLERAFENLVRNAAEAAGPRGHLWVEFARGGGAATVAIADDGPGIPPERRSELRPFFSTKAAGLGLGLPIALKIVRLHGGEMTLEDRPPRGLRVVVRLPEGAGRG